MEYYIIKGQLVLILFCSTVLFTVEVSHYCLCKILWIFRDWCINHVVSLSLQPPKKGFLNPDPRLKSLSEICFEICLHRSHLSAGSWEPGGWHLKKGFLPNLFSPTQMCNFSLSKVIIDISYTVSEMWDMVTNLFSASC